MHVAQFILASGDDTELFKLIAIAVILVIGAIGSVVKKVRDAQATQARRAVPPPLPVQPAPSASRLAAPSPTPLPPLPALARGAKPRAAAARRTVPRPSIVRPQAAPARQQAIAQSPRSDPMRPAVSNAPTAPPVPRSQIAMLLNPTTIRAQFILAEVLQPPLSLRTRKTF